MVRLVSNYVFMKQGVLTRPVEWAYCFDVHLNAFIPLVIFVYGVQAAFWPCKSSIFTRINNYLFVFCSDVQLEHRQCFDNQYIVVDDPYQLLVCDFPWLHDPSQLH